MLKFLVFIFLSLAISFFPLVVYAANPLGNITIPNNIRFLNRYRGAAGITVFIANAVSLVFIIALIAVFFFLIFGGLKWLTSGGDKQRVEAAKNMITAAIIGFVIVALAYAVTRLIGMFFGIDIFGGSRCPLTTCEPVSGPGGCPPGCRPKQLAPGGWICCP